MADLERWAKEMSTVFIVIICLVAVVALLMAFSKKTQPISATSEEVATSIENFVEGRGGDHDWDDFLHFPLTDTYLESVRKKCDSVFTEYPATLKGHYCSDAGTAVLRALAADVRSRAQPVGTDNSGAAPRRV